MRGLMLERHGERHASFQVIPSMGIEQIRMRLLLLFSNSLSLEIERRRGCRAFDYLV